MKWTCSSDIIQFISQRNIQYTTFVFLVPSWCPDRGADFGSPESHYQKIDICMSRLLNIMCHV